MIIYLIRHGETTSDVEDRYGGEYDDHLTDKGKEQCNKLAQKINDKKIEIIYHSPKIRAIETAKILAKTIKADLQKVEDIKERNHSGILTGMIKSEAKEKYPEEIAKLEKDKKYHAITGSESYDSFKNRIINAFRELFNTDHNTIAVVTHGGPITCYIREVLDLGEFEYLGDCAYLKLEVSTDRTVILSLHNASLEK